MSVTIGGTTPQLTFADATVQNTAALPLTGGSVSADITVHGLTVGQGSGSVSTNTAVGASALSANTTGANNVGIGYNAGYYNQTGTENTFVGFSANGNGSGGTSGSYNTGVGRAVLNNNYGNYNTAVGDGALQLNTTASYNTAVGYQAGYNETIGASNLYLGYAAGYSNTQGNGNTFVGNAAGYLFNNTSNATTVNTFVGAQAGYSVTTGAKNTIIGGFNGNQGGLDIRTASNYIVLSDGDGNPRGIFDSSGNLLVGATSAVYAGKISVGFSSTGSQGIALIDNTAATGGIYAYFINSAGNVAGSITHNGTTSVNYGSGSDYRLKENITPMINALAKVALLKPCTYTWKSDGSNGQGFIAHELQEICPDAVVGEKDALNENGSIKTQTVDTSFLVATLTSAIQELSTQVTTLQAQVTALQAKVGV